MKRIASTLFAAFLLGGCVSPAETVIAPRTTVKEVANVSDLSWQEVNGNRLLMTIDHRSQTLSNSLTESPVGVFSIDSDYVGLKISLKSPVNELTVFAPNLAVYDQDFNLIQNFDSSHFSYNRDDFILGEALSGDVEFLVPESVNRLNFVVYTTASDLMAETVLIHPAKAMAIAKRNDPPKIPDPIAKHVDFGEIEISIEPLSLSVNKHTGSSVITTKAPQVAVLEDTRNYYIRGIEKAVAENNLDKALSLLEEAKSLNVEGAQQAFIKAVNAK
ncbi:maltose-binding protein [Vibrio sp. JPW-9-11-11]|uniref:MalM family protein n=1 Tax=Vibrio sp. JPW-9-11-11 TaxID=1416532 RepID=UPI00159350C7|nr:MalM family protein [Vibrio sp. JPW-9-11-11]NVD08527.1 maltose-binding protein [Vibrio sp. JPW-9-11-11]